MAQTRRTTAELYTSLAAVEPTTGSACDHWAPAAVPCKQFVLTCDGSFIRPRSGGWAFVLIDRSNKEKLIRFGGRNCTSASHAELCAAIRGLSKVPRGAAVLLVSDSRYVVDGIGNLPTWKCDRWHSASGPLKHLKLWQRMDRLLQHRRVTCRWVPGHSGHRLHDLCDELARRAANDHANGQLPKASRQEPAEQALV